MAMTEMPLGHFMIEDDVMTIFILKDDGLVYLRFVSGEEEGPITVKQFMQGVDMINGTLTKWRKEARGKHQ